MNKEQKPRWPDSLMSNSNILSKIYENLLYENILVISSKILF